MTEDKFEDFLSGEGGVGRLDSEGVFTVAADGADLKKLATYSLPFDGAWAVKIVQAMVAAGARQEIKVSLGKEWTRFSCRSPQFCTCEEFERALSSASPTHNTALDHLIQGLRAVSMKHERPFELTLPQIPVRILWNGEQLSSKKLDFAGDGVVVRVGHFNESKAKGSNWFTRRAEVARKNTDVLNVLRERCFVCPVALHVDGLRLDSLLNYARIETAVDYPLLLTFPKIDSPQWPVPPGTFVPSGQNLLRGLRDRWQLSNRSAGERTANATGAVLVTASFTHGHRVDLEPQLSQVFWVADGAVVEKATLGLRRLFVSVQLFLSAKDLDTDLTGFQLRKAKAQEARLTALRQSVRRELRRRDPGRADRTLSSLENPPLPNDTGGSVAWMVIAATFAMAFPSVAVLKGIAVTSIVGGALQGTRGAVQALPRVEVHYRHLQSTWDEFMARDKS